MAVSDDLTRKPPLAPISVSTVISKGDTITLDATACASLLTRKINVKEAFTLCDANHTFFRASLTALEPHAGSALVYEQLQHSPESPARITLACAVLQRQRMLIVAQKATELGAIRIQPLFTARSVQLDGLEHEKYFAWPGQTLKGARQCRRASLPEMARTTTLSEFLQSAVWQRASVRVYLDDRSEPEALAALTLAPNTPRPEKEYVLLVGPEGGFAEHERTQLHDAGALALRLGGRVLRAETAVFAGMTVLQMLVGDMGG